tara:strand:+ start:70 stop:1098 length:1029 start_codon:yes stop_codon:yes gene_type:complete
MDRDSGELKALRTALKMLGKTEAEASKFIAEKDVKGTKAIAKSVLPGDYDILEKEGVSKNFVKSVAKDLATDIAVGAGLGVLGAGAVMGAKAAGKGVKALRKAAKARRMAKQPPKNVRTGPSAIVEERVTVVGRKPDVMEVTNIRKEMSKATKESKATENEIANLKENRNRLAEGFKNLKGKRRAATQKSIEGLNKRIRDLEKGKISPRKREPRISQMTAAQKKMTMRPTEVLEPMNLRDALEAAISKKKTVKPATIKIPQNVAREIDRAQRLKFGARPLDQEDLMDTVAQSQQALNLVEKELKQGGFDKEQTVYLETVKEELTDQLRALQGILKKFEGEVN